MLFFRFDDMRNAACEFQLKGKTKYIQIEG